MFFIIGISIAVFLEFLLLIKKDKSRADKILTLWLFLLAINQAFNYLLYSNEIYNYPHLLGIDLSMPILQGVFLYFYTLEITGKRLKRKWFIFLHLIPTLSVILLAIPFYTLSASEKVYVYQNDGVGFEWFLIYLNAVIIVSGLVYSIWSLLLIRKHQFNIQEQFSNTEQRELQWLKYLAIGLGLIWVLTIFFSSEIIFGGVVVFVLFIGFFGINQLNIFNTNQPVQAENSTANKSVDRTDPSGNTQKRYAKSGLSEEKADQLYSKLLQLMEQESLFKENDLTLVELAKQLKVHPNHLSQVINEKEQKNFYYYINSLRVKEFIKLASIPGNKKYTLLSLAFECGFNSKSTFNKHFKEFSGKTPTEYFKS